MQTVNFSINGRSFRLSCPDGKQDYVMELAGELNRRAENVAAKSETTSDSHMLVIVAMALLDELNDKNHNNNNDNDNDINRQKNIQDLTNISKRIKKLADNIKN